jgi:ribulose-phosphate 3-epimerase
VLAKVRQLRGWLDERGAGAELEVDGGVDRETGPLAAAAGATVFVAAYAVFKTGRPIADSITQLRAALVDDGRQTMDDGRRPPPSSVVGGPSSIE